MLRIRVISIKFRAARTIWIFDAGTEEDVDTATGGEVLRTALLKMMQRLQACWI
jgi:hypothetical protein